MKLTIIIIALSISLLPPFSSAETFKAHCRNFPPELSFDGKKCVGPIPDLITDILKELGHEISWSEKPFIRTIKEAQKGDVDIVIRHSMTPERALFLSAAPYGYITRELSFYRSPMFKLPISGYDDIKKYNIGAIRGLFYSPSFTLLDTNVLTSTSSTQQLINMLERGRIDLAVTSASHSEELFKGRFEKVAFVDRFDNPMHISIPKKSLKIKYYPEVAELLLKYRKQGKVEVYYKKYNIPAPKQVFE